MYDYIKCGDSAILMEELEDESIDLTVTSPPYDGLRTYNGYVFDFEKIAKELYRVTKPGGVVVWIVADATIDGSETGTSFRQALYFKDIGFNLHDTMIWNKNSFTATGTLQTRYASVFEYMFVLSKGKPKTFNPIKDRKNLHGGEKHQGTIRQINGTMKQKSTTGKILTEYGQRFNIWDISPERSNETGHPAVFPVNLIQDHITSWSNEGDVVFDPFLGSGTTAIAARRTNRHFIGFEISEEYFEKTKKRIEEEISQYTLFDVFGNGMKEEEEHG